MLYLIIYGVLVLNIFTPSNGLDYSRIVNGTATSAGDYPYVVSIRYYQQHECGGSIIGSKWVLTAAHCIYPSYIDVATILYGTIYLQNGESPENNTANIANAYMHENYVNVSGYDNDIGLLELKKELVFNAYVQPVSLPQLYEKTPTGSEATLVGWGYSETNGTVMDVLQVVDIYVYSDESCYEAHDGVTNPKVHICAGITEGGKGQCTGDSGGPLTVNNLQYGIVSWSVKPCGVKGYPGVFSKVSTYRWWIYEKTNI